MKAKDIITTSMKLLGIDVPYEIIDSEESASSQAGIMSNTQLVKLIDCLNSVLQQLACQSAPNVKYEEVFAENGIIDYSKLQFSPLEVLQLTDSMGTNVPYRYIVGGLMTECSGRMSLTYTTEYEKAGVWSEITLSNNKLTERALAYGVCAEYCLLSGDYTTCSIWEQKYTQALENAMYKRSEKRIKERRWL